MNTSLRPVILIGALILAAAALIFLTRKRGLPDGEVIYEDLVRGGKASETLFSNTYELTGKPDMIIRKGKELIPVEIKHAPGGDRPRPSHVLQLAAYCLLIGENYGVRPAYGIIRYRDRQFEVPYTADLEKKLLQTMASMRREDPERVLPPVIANRRKCLACPYAENCFPGERPL